MPNSLTFAARRYWLAAAAARAAIGARFLARTDHVFPAAGQIVGVRLRVGQDLLGDPRAARSGAGQSVCVRGCRRPQAAGGADRGRPGGFPARGRPGLLVIGYLQ